MRAFPDELALFGRRQIPEHLSGRGAVAPNGSNTRQAIACQTKGHIDFSRQGFCVHIGGFAESDSYLVLGEVLFVQDNRGFGRGISHRRPTPAPAVVLPPLVDELLPPRAPPTPPNAPPTAPFAPPTAPSTESPKAPASRDAENATAERLTSNVAVISLNADFISHTPIHIGGNYPPADGSRQFESHFAVYDCFQ